MCLSYVLVCTCSGVTSRQVCGYACLCMFSDKKVLLWYMSVLASVHCLVLRYLSMVYMYMATACLRK